MWQRGCLEILLAVPLQILFSSVIVMNVDYLHKLSVPNNIIITWIRIWRSMRPQYVSYWLFTEYLFHRSCSKVCCVGNGTTLQEVTIHFFFLFSEFLKNGTRIDRTQQLEFTVNRTSSRKYKFQIKKSTGYQLLRPLAILCFSFQVHREALKLHGYG
jgi:hypothetical protein